jgi:hypothetical protein
VISVGLASVFEHEDLQAALKLQGDEEPRFLKKFLSMVFFMVLPIVRKISH